MELIAKLIELALVECYERGMIDWIPGDGEPEVFNAECEIEYVGTNHGGWWNGDYHIIMAGVYTIIDATHMEAWHSSRIHNPEICASNPCDYCLA